MMMAFADTFYFIALLSPADEAHAKAVAFTQQFASPLLTTAWVLTELADGLVDSRAKRRFSQFYDRLRTRGDVTIVPSDPEWFDQGMDQFRRRLDKEWSLTDCNSFVVMERKHVTAALTADRHFEQAGFRALLK